MNSSEIVWAEKKQFNYIPKFNLDQAIKIANAKCSLRSIFQHYNFQFEFHYSNSGWNEKICCPLPGHNDDTPSFYFHPEKNVFHCYGCHKSGGPVQFISFYSQVSYTEALKIIIEQKFSSLDKKPTKSNSEKEILVLLRDFTLRVSPRINSNNIIEFEKVNWILSCFLRKNKSFSEINLIDLTLLLQKLESRLLK